MPGTPNSLYNTNDSHFLRVVLGNIDANIAAQTGGGTAGVKAVSVTPVYDTTGSRTLLQATMSDGTVRYYTDSAATTQATGVITIGPFPSGAGASISLGAGAVDATTTRVKLSTEDEGLVSKAGTSQWVKDVDTDVLIWQEAVYDAATGVFTYTYLTAPGGAPFTVGSTVAPASVSTGEVVTVAKVDDVAGDQSGALVNYVEIREINPDTGVSTLIGTKTEDLSADYTVLGTPRNATEIGVNAKTSPFSLQLPVGDWTPPLLTESFAYAVLAVGDTNDPPTFTDADNVTTNLFREETANFQLSANTESLNITNVKITVKTGDVVKVYGTKYSV